MSTTSLPRYLRRLWRDTLKPAGWSWRFTGSDHIALDSPSGATVYCAATPRSTDETAKRVACDCRRMGASR